MVTMVMMMHLVCNCSSSDKFVAGSSDSLAPFPPLQPISDHLSLLTYLCSFQASCLWFFELHSFVLHLLSPPSFQLALMKSCGLEVGSVTFETSLRRQALRDVLVQGYFRSCCSRTSFSCSCRCRRCCFPSLHGSWNCALFSFPFISDLRWGPRLVILDGAFQFKSNRSCEIRDSRGKFPKVAAIAGYSGAATSDTQFILIR